MRRMVWVDAAKGVGIILVCFGHVWRGLDNGGLLANAALFRAVDVAIYLFHMPLFFILSGVLFQKSVERKGIARSAALRIETLIYPLILWAYVFAAFLYLAASVTSRPPLSGWEIATFPFPPKDIFWFVWALFLVQIVSLPLTRLGTGALATVLVAAIALVFATTEHEIHSTVQPAIRHLPYFLVGMIWGRLLAQPPHDRPKAAMAGLAVAAFLGAEAWILAHPQMLPTAWGFVGGGIAAAAVCYVAFALARFLPARVAAGLEFLGGAAMAIYLTHIFFLSATRLVLVKLGIASAPVHLLVGTAATLLGPLALYCIVRRFGLMRLAGFGPAPRAAEKAPPPATSLPISTSIR